MGNRLVDEYDTAKGFAATVLALLGGESGPQAACRTNK
jgi:hypothetical protein